PPPKMSWGAPLKTESADARSGANAVDPGLHRRKSGFELDAEAAEDHDARRERRIGEREFLADEIFMSGELVAQIIEATPELFARLVDALLIALGIGFAQLREQHRRRRDERVVAVILEHPHRGTSLRVLGHQPGERILVLEVLVDDCGVVDYL